MSAAKMAPKRALHCERPAINTATARPGSNECEMVPILSADFRSTTKALTKPLEKPIIKHASNARLAMGSARKSVIVGIW